VSRDGIENGVVDVTISEAVAYNQEIPIRSAQNFSKQRQISVQQRLTFQGLGLVSPDD
jgi:hypothetical protein